MKPVYAINPQSNTPIEVFDPTKLYTKRQVTAQTGISRDHLNTMMRCGTLPYIQFSRTIHFYGAKLNEFIDRHAVHKPK